MEIYSILASGFTVVSFVLFIGIVAWAYSRRRAPGFEAAAREPFALPDESDAPARSRASGAPR